MPLTRSELEPVDFRAVFEQSLCLHLLLDPAMIIVAVSEPYLKATMTTREAIVGHFLFEIFPDNPDDSGADGVINLRHSLLHVIKTRARHVMAVQKYDVRRDPGRGFGFEERWWRPNNWPILGPDGFVRWIVHQVEDVTEQMRGG